MRRRQGDAADTAVEGLRWLSIRQRMLLSSPPADDDPDYRDGWVLPVLTQVGPDADDESKDDTCPSCQQKDGIRFLGSAIATLLSVTLSTLFGDEALDPREKKALVFTDSVQDAAHRAGFVESRSHTLTLRALLRHAVGDHPVSLDALVDQAIAAAGDDPFRRYRIIPPDLVERDEFAPFWQRPRAREIPARVRTRVRRRLLFDAVLEFGLQSRVGRTLEQTGSAVVEVDAGEPVGARQHRPRRAHRHRRPGHPRRGAGRPARRPAGGLGARRARAHARAGRDRARVVPGVHPARREPLLHLGRPAARPGHARVPARPLRARVPADRPGRPGQGPAARPRQQPAVLVRALDRAGARRHRRPRRAAGPAAARAPRPRRHPAHGRDRGRRHRVRHPGELGRRQPDRRGGDARRAQPAHLHRLPDAAAGHRHGRRPARRRAVHARALPRAAAPRAAARTTTTAACTRRRTCAGSSPGSTPAWSTTRTRLRYESEFKQSTSDPNAPNVLVATPTLEMGIDIGDLSAVLLASLPKTVASYLQRVGRAGRLTGSALNLAFITGRGEQLPRLENPLSVINGQVRAPATYLSAEEILRRQYVAHLVDCFAREDDRPHPRRARGALGSAEPGSFLGELIRFAEDGADGHLDRFLGSFDGLAEASVESLRGWATPADGEPNTSGLAAHLYDASQRWVAAVEGLAHRRAAIQPALPELERIADSPAASDDDRRALRSARAALTMTRNESAAADGRVLDRGPRGVRDPAQLHAARRHGHARRVGDLDRPGDPGVPLRSRSSFARSSANALREFAPGATFYARGLEILIDAVDLGPDDSAIRSMAFCPNCGFALDLSAPGPAGTAPSRVPALRRGRASPGPSTASTSWSSAGSRRSCGATRRPSTTATTSASGSATPSPWPPTSTRPTSPSGGTSTTTTSAPSTCAGWSSAG